MSQTFALPENILQSLYATTDVLPPVWEVIYQEGMRQNHILFPAERLRAWADNTALAADGLDGISAETLADTVLGILHCSRLSDMQMTIRALDDRMMRVCFVLYLHALGWWQNHLRRSLLH